MRQRGTKIRAGDGVGMGKDHTLFAIRDGYVYFEDARPEVGVCLCCDVCQSRSAFFFFFFFFFLLLLLLLAMCPVAALSVMSALCDDTPFC